MCLFRSLSGSYRSYPIENSEFDYNTLSEWKQVISGIPQGSILGPLLFLIFVNDLQKICLLGPDLYLHADDSKLFR